MVAPCPLRPQADRIPEMALRLAQPLTIALRVVHERRAQVVETNGARGVRVHRPAPERLRALPHAALATASRGQEDHDEGGRRRQGDDHAPSQDPTLLGPPGEQEGAAREEREPEAGEIAVPIVGELVPGVYRAAHGKEHEGGVGPGRQPRGPPPARHDEGGRDGEPGAEGHEEAGRHGIYLPGQLVERGELHGPDPLPWVEDEAVGGHGDARGGAVVGVGRDRDPLSQSHQSRYRGGAGERRVRDLLDEDPSPPQPEASEWVDVEEEQDGGQRHGRGFRQHGERACDDGASVPPPASRRIRLHRAQIEQDGQEEEHSADHVAPLGDPGHGLDPQRVDGEDEAREGGRPQMGPRGEIVSCGGGEEAAGQIEEQHGVHRVDQDVDEVVSPRVHAAQDIVQAQGQPGHRDVVTHEGGPEHPADLGPAETAIVLVLDEVALVVPVEELAREARREGEDRDGDDNEEGGPRRPGGCPRPGEGGATSDQRYAPFPSGRSSTRGRPRS